MMRKALPFEVIALSLLDAADQPIDYLTFHNNSAPINFTVRLALYLPAPLSAPAAGFYGLVTTSLVAPFPALVQPTVNVPPDLEPGLVIVKLSCQVVGTDLAAHSRLHLLLSYAPVGPADPQLNDLFWKGVFLNTVIPLEVLK